MEFVRVRAKRRIADAALATVLVLATGNSALASPCAERFYPREVVSAAEPRFLVEFDGPVDAAAALASVEVEAGGRRYPVALLTDAQVAADYALSSMVYRSRAGQWVAFHTTGEIPPDVPVQVRVGCRIYDLRSTLPFKVEGVTCDRAEEGPCPPGSSWTLHFSNPVAPFRPIEVEKDPPTDSLPVMSRYDGADLSMRALAKPGTSYHLRISGDVRDVFGQRLAGPWEGQIAVGASADSLASPNVVSGPLVVLGPGSGARIPVLSIGRKDDLLLALYRVGVEDYPAAARYLARRSSLDPQTPPGTLAAESVLSRVGADPFRVRETDIDISPALSGASGAAFALLGDGSSVSAFWLQKSELSVDVFALGIDLVAWVTSLRDGRPVAGASVRVFPGGASAVTDRYGIARLRIVAETGGDGYVVVKNASDWVVLPESSAPPFPSVARNNTGMAVASWITRDRPWGRAGVVLKPTRYFLFDDGATLRAGGRWRAVGWVRAVGKGPNWSLSAPPVPASVPWHLSCGKESTSGKAITDTTGRFSLDLAIPADAERMCTVSVGEAGLSPNEPWYRSMLLGPTPVRTPARETVPNLERRLDAVKPALVVRADPEVAAVGEKLHLTVESVSKVASGVVAIAGSGEKAYPLDFAGRTKAELDLPVTAEDAPAICLTVVLNLVDAAPGADPLFTRMMVRVVPEKGPLKIRFDAPANAAREKAFEVRARVETRNGAPVPGAKIAVRAVSDPLGKLRVEDPNVVFHDRVNVYRPNWWTLREFVLPPRPVLLEKMLGDYLGSPAWDRGDFTGPARRPGRVVTPHAGDWDNVPMQVAPSVAPRSSAAFLPELAASADGWIHFTIDPAGTGPLVIEGVAVSGELFGSGGTIVTVE